MKLLFFFVTSFFWFSLYTYVPYVAPYAEYLGADLRLVGLIAGAYGFTQMAIRFPLGIFSDRIGKRKIFVVLGMAFAAAAGFVVFFFPSAYTLLLARALGGVAASAWVVFTVLGASYYPADKTAKAMGHLSACNALGRMAALLMGGLAAQWLGVEYAFLLGGIGALIGMATSATVKEKTKKTTQPPSDNNIHSNTNESNTNENDKPPPPTFAELLTVAKNKQLLCCSILGILCMFISFATTFGFIPLAASRLEANQIQIGLLGVVSTVPGIFMAPLAGSFMPKKFGACTTLVIGFLIAGVGSALVAFSNSLPSLFAVQIIGSIGIAIPSTLLLGLCIRDIPAPRRATAMGFYQAVYGIGMFLGPFVMGQISYALGLMTAFIFIGVVGVAGALLTIVYARRGNLVY
ncbi:MAG: MFS transporter [Defluviitaleaceae bacterium]|nr:MFS transporter [Defluviitaleaceae bacterium]